MLPHRSRLHDKKLITLEEGTEDLRKSNATINLAGLDPLKRKDMYIQQMIENPGKRFAEDELWQLSSLCEKI